MKKNLLLSIFLFTLLVSCEDVFDCIVGRNPSLPNAELPIASTEAYYYADISAEIKNEPRDNDYDYYFRVVGLPPGMDYFVNYRIVSFEGTPTETGTYEVRVYLDVDGPFRNDFDGDRDVLCNYSTSKTYTLIVE